MPQDLNLKDFSAGWCPSDDPVNGRINGLLNMDSLELDQNGALRMSGGSTLLYTYPTDAHTIFSKFIQSNPIKYAALLNGAVYRGNTSIVTGGSATRAGFGAAYDYVIICSGDKRVKDDGTTVTNLGLATPTVPVTGLNGAGILNGDLTYVQINVTRNGAYIAKSPPSVEAVAVTAVDNKVNIDPSNPPGGVNEVWIFRRGGDLDQYYRVMRQIASLGTAFDDNVSDTDALDEGVTLDLNALTVNSTDLPDAILEVVGPVNNRQLYFTKNGIHISEVNSPDSYHATQSLYYAGGATGAEVFLFARKLSESAVLVGTTRDFYLLTGTFITQVDGTLDIYLRNLHVENPPISIDADTFNNTVICMTAAGWKITSADGSQIGLEDTRVDRLYRGETLQGYGGVPIFIMSSLRYSCAVIREKLYARVPQIVGNDPTAPYTYRMEVYDFKRKYWRPLPEFAPLMIFGQEDDSVIGFFDTSHTLRSIDDQFTKKNNGVNQTIKFKPMVLTFDKPLTRKQIFNVSFKMYTASTNVTLNVYTNTGVLLVYSKVLTTGILEDIIIDLDANIGLQQDIQLEITGSPDDFSLSNLNVNFDYRPDPVTTQIFIFNTGPNKKRVSGWPIKINTRFNDVLCTPEVDGVTYSQSTFATANYDKTFIHQFTSDIFGTDFRFKVQSSVAIDGGVFEVLEIGKLEILETLPLAKRYDQIGPIELYRYGKLKEFEVRMITFGGSIIPYEIFFEDVSVQTGTLSFSSAKESIQFLNLPRGLEGEILRVTFGPTAFDFHRLYGRMKVQKSGKDSENVWITVDNQLVMG